MKCSLGDNNSHRPQTFENGVYIYMHISECLLFLWCLIERCQSFTSTNDFLHSIQTTQFILKCITNGLFSDFIVSDPLQDVGFTFLPCPNSLTDPIKIRLALILSELSSLLTLSFQVNEIKPWSGNCVFSYRAVHRWALFISWAAAKRHPCIESGRTPLSSSFPTVHFLWKQERRWAQEGFGCVCHFYDMYVECNVFHFYFSRTHHHRTII